jgi:hypothetical protein
VPPAGLRPGLPGWLEDVILRLLNKNPDDRFPSATEVAATLARHAEG